MDAGRIVVLTGATHGLGRALALRLADLGHTVLGCGRSPGEIAELSRSLAAPHDFQVVDVAEGSQVEGWAARLLAIRPIPDLLLNNAGLINANAPLWEVPEEEFSRVVDVNLKGVFHVLRSFLPALLPERRGVVVNFSSGWGRSAAPEVAPYCATKWGIEGLTRALAQELPRGVAAVAVNPGVVHTRLLDSCFGRAALTYPGPERWAERAVPFLLGLSAADNGRSLTVPG